MELSDSEYTDRQDTPTAYTRTCRFSPTESACSCGVETSILWRNCGGKYLCNACGLRWHRGKRCAVCSKVYYDKDVYNGSFLKCQTCYRLLHRDCSDKHLCLNTKFTLPKLMPPRRPVNKKKFTIDLKHQYQRAFIADVIR